MKLEAHEIDEWMATMTGWKREEKTIVKRFRFASFPEAVAYVNRVALIAEEMMHHPFISIDYKVVTMKLTSWHAGGLTTQDFEEAQALDALYAELTDGLQARQDEHGEKEEK